MLSMAFNHSGVMSVSAQTHTSFDKSWDAHIRQLAGEPALILIDRRFISAATLSQVFCGLERARREVCGPDLRFAATDHTVPTIHRRLPMANDKAARKTKAKARFDTLSRNSRESGIALVLNPFPMEK
jgi:3-isopropylmalate/(R)-2-methylmalate dehydratase large subunit